jgi:DNA adenine methylase
MTKENPLVKPYLKWAGGKGQLLNDLQKKYPYELGKSIKKYCEPFVGGGAVLFDILSKYEMDEILINDINSDLINTYIQIRNNLSELINQLQPMQDFYSSAGKEEREIYYYKKRDLFNNLKLNQQEENTLIKSALFIFLNRTCFNGLYRVNRQGFFNVPIGKYKNPTICDYQNLLLVSEHLKNVDIKCGDFGECLSFIDKNTFVYIDPPYRPLNETSMFTSYTENNFNDSEQIRLSKFVDEINLIGAKVTISNSDPKNANSNDDFFDDLYSEYEIKRVTAKRMINCNGENRGDISELLITNY